MLTENLASTMDGTRVPTVASAPTSMCQNSVPSSPITQFYSINKSCIGSGGTYEWAFAVEGTLTLARGHGGFTPCCLCVQCQQIWGRHSNVSHNLGER